MASDIVQTTGSQTYARRVAVTDSSGNIIDSFGGGGAGADPVSLVPTNTTVTVNATSTTILAANADRTGALIKNTGAQTVFLHFNAAATTARYPLGVGEFYETAYNGLITGIVASGTGSVFVTEEAHA